MVPAPMSYLCCWIWGRERALPVREEQRAAPAQQSPYLWGAEQSRSDLVRYGGSSVIGKVGWLDERASRQPSGNVEWRMNQSINQSTVPKGNGEEGEEEEMRWSPAANGGREEGGEESGIFEVSYQISVSLAIAIEIRVGDSNSRVIALMWWYESERESKCPIWTSSLYYLHFATSSSV